VFCCRRDALRDMEGASAPAKTNELMSIHGALRGQDHPGSRRAWNLEATLQTQRKEELSSIQ
jgi:hypothetical protein